MALRRADVQPLALVGSYADGRPLDPGTAWVLSDGRQIVHDPPACSPARARRPVPLADAPGPSSVRQPRSEKVERQGGDGGQESRWNARCTSPGVNPPI